MAGHITDFAVAATPDGGELLEVSQLSASVAITATTISAAASDNSYNDSGSGFVAAGFAVDDRVCVTGFTGNVANNIAVGVVTALTAGKMTIGGTDGDVIVDDAAGESVTISKWVTRRITSQDIADLAGASSGGLIGIQKFTAGSHTYTPTLGTNSIFMRLQGAGGGGGGVASPGSGNVARAFAGCAGGYLEKYLTANFSGAALVVGAKGTGGTAGNNNGTAGGDTTFTDTAGSPTVYTASGGALGSGSTGFAPPLAQSSAGGAAATNGDLNIAGGPTKPAVALSTSALIGSGGGDARLGFGATPKALTATASTSNGNNAPAGFGGGGGGGIATTTGAAASGGDGADGVIEIFEFN